MKTYITSPCGLFVSAGTVLTLRGSSYISYRVYDWKDRVHSSINRISFFFKVSSWGSFWHKLLHHISFVQWTAHCRLFLEQLIEKNPKLFRHITWNFNKQWLYLTCMYVSSLVWCSSLILKRVISLCTMPYIVVVFLTWLNVIHSQLLTSWCKVVAPLVKKFPLVWNLNVYYFFHRSCCWILF